MNYFGESAGGSSSRKGKKSGSDKPKQPQRGLGVAQLEKIRIHSQMGFLPQVININSSFINTHTHTHTVFWSSDVLCKP